MARCQGNKVNSRTSCAVKRMYGKRGVFVQTVISVSLKYDQILVICSYAQTYVATRETKDNFLGTVQQALDKVPLAEAFVLPWFKGGRYIC